MVDGPPPVAWEHAGQPAATTSLRESVARDEVGHAMLLVGPAGVGQAELATSFAAALNCPDAVDGTGCGTCSVCRRTVEGTHTALVQYEPEGANHLIGTVREEWLPEAYRTLVEGNRRVMRIVAADQMNEAAQNAFLKALEEPGPSTVWLLEAEDDRALLETITSRCRRIDVAPWSPADLARRGRDLGLPEDRLAGLTRAANGSPRRLESFATRECPTCGKAFAMSRRGGRWRLPDGVVGEDGVARCDNTRARAHTSGSDDELVLDRGRDLHLGLVDHLHVQGPGAVTGWVGQVMARADMRRKAVAAVHEEELSQLQEDLGVKAGRGWPPGMKARIEKRHKRAEREAAAQSVTECLDDIGTLLRDLLVVQAGGADTDLVNVDRAADLRRDGARLGAREAIEALAGISWVRQAMSEFNGVPALQLESLLIPVAVGVYRAGN